MTQPSITTRRGDDGETELFSGERIPKHNPRTSAYGDMDELSSVLGVARAHASRREVAGALREIQQWLFRVNAELATSRDQVAKLPDPVDEDMVAELDERCLAVESIVALPTGFIIPGGTAGGAHVDHARSISRRCERRIVALHHDGETENRYLLAWINRLSDYLWLLARVEEGEAVDLKDG